MIIFVLSCEAMIIDLHFGGECNKRDDSFYKLFNYEEIR